MVRLPPLSPRFPSMLDGDLEPEDPAQILLQRPGIRILGRRRPAGRLGRPGGQGLGLADREAKGDDAFRQGHGIGGGDQGAGVAGAELALLQQILDRLRQLQQPQRIGDMGPALADLLGQLFLGVANSSISRR